MYLWPLTCDKILQQYRDNGGTKEAQIQYKSEGSGSPAESSYPDWARLQTLYDPYATKSSETGYAISSFKSQFFFKFILYNMISEDLCVWMIRVALYSKKNILSDPLLRVSNFLQVAFQTVIYQ